GAPREPDEEPGFAPLRRAPRAHRRPLARARPDGGPAQAQHDRRRRRDRSRDAQEAAAGAARAHLEEPRSGRSVRRALAVSALALSACTALTGPDRVNPEVPSWFSHPSGDMSLMFRRSLTIEGRKVGEDYEQGRPEIDPEHARV